MYILRLGLIIRHVLHCLHTHKQLSLIVAHYLIFLNYANSCLSSVFVRGILGDVRGCRGIVEWSARLCHYHTLRHCVFRAKVTKTMSLRRLHKLVVGGLIYSICVQGTPESLVYFLNLFGKSRTRIFTGRTRSSCNWFSLLHLWVDLPAHFLGLGLVWITRRFRSYCCTSVSLHLCLSAELYYLKISLPIFGLPHLITNSIIVSCVLCGRASLLQVVKRTFFRLLKNWLRWRAHFI